jgi:hypothetical protein
MPLPKPIAQTAVDAFKDVTQPQANRIAAVSSIIMATPDPGQRQMLFNQMVQQGLPDVTQGAFEALSRGDTAAAQRLFQAAMVDPKELAGNIPNGIKTSDIDQAVQANIMDQGKVGDIYYGLSSGTAENYTRAQRDSKLINNAVNIRLRNGETMDQAIAGVSKDLYGDVQVINQGHMQILVPSQADKGAAITELSAKLPEVETALKNAIAVPPGTNPSAKAIIETAAANHIPNVLANGFFRNSGDGFVFIDPYTDSAVADESGAPIIFKITGNLPPSPNAPLTNLGTTGADTQQLNQMRRTMGQ